MPSFRSAASQAAHAVRALAAHGQPRHGHADDGKIHSKGTERNYTQALKGVAEFIQERKLGDLRGLSRETALAYLEARSQAVGQKTLDLDRQAMQAVLGGDKLPTVKSEIDQALASRAYTPAQARLVSEAQHGRHRLAHPGRRQRRAARPRTAHPPARRRATARPAPRRQRPRVPRRPLRRARQRRDLHRDRQGRAVPRSRPRPPPGRAPRSQPPPQPRTVYDRGIRYQQHYDIGGGKPWSDSFSQAARRALGWSEGAHGLRHSYAQARMDALQGAGRNYHDALAVVSQEMGHFRADITEVYLR